MSVEDKKPQVLVRGCCLTDERPYLVLACGHFACGPFCLQLQLNCQDCQRASSNWFEACNRARISSRYVAHFVDGFGSKA